MTVHSLRSFLKCDFAPKLDGLQDNALNFEGLEGHKVSRDAADSGVAESAAESSSDDKYVDVCTCRSGCHSGDNQ